VTGNAKALYEGASGGKKGKRKEGRGREEEGGGSLRFLRGSSAVDWRVRMEREREKGREGGREREAERRVRD
jgi:hypothetical protein